MKRLLSLALILTMLLALMPLTAFAADNKNYEVSFDYIETAPKIDGVVNTREYGSELPFHTYSTSTTQFKDNEHNRLKGLWDVNFYSAWDKDNLYMAWVVDSDVHGPLPDAQFKEAPANAGEPIEGTKISDNPEAAAAHMWTYSYVEFLITPGAPNQGTDYSGNYLEVAFCEDENGDTQKAIWKVPTSMQLDEVNLNDWSAVAKRDEATKTTTYEIAIPWKYSGVNAIGNNQQFGLSYAVSTQEYYFKNNRTEMAMIEWQDAILSTKFPNRCAVVTLAGAPTNDITVIHKELKPGTLPSSANGKPQIGISNINEGIVNGNEGTLITDPSMSLGTLNWAYSALLKPTSEEGVYELVEGVMGMGEPIIFQNRFENGMLVIGVHTDSIDANSVAWANVLKALLPGSKLGLFGVDLAKNERTYSNSMLYVIEVAQEPSEEPDDSEDVYDYDYEINPNETLNVEIVEDELTYIKFVPSVSGYYVFESISNDDTYVYLYDSEMTQLVSNDDGENGLNFYLSYSFNAGETYYFGVRFYSWGAGSFDVVLSSEDSSDEPDDSEDEEYYDYEINPNETLNVEIVEDELTYIKFVPSVSGYYVFESISDSDTYAYLYDSEMYYLDSNDDGGSGGNFRIVNYFNAGETYYFGVRFYSWGAGSFDVVLSGSEDGFRYTLSDNGTYYIISDYYGVESEVVIPSEYNGLPVKVIGDYAFYDCENLTSVTIPDSVTTIGDYAFYDCESLTSITIPDSVTTIGEGAFEGCDSLRSITIPDSVTTIGDYAFYGCDGLTNITIPDSVTTIGDYAFYYCESLTNITIPDSVTTIGEGAFYGCSSLASIEIPDSVMWIGDSAFANCQSLTSINIPYSVTWIDSYAFDSCSGLETITVDSRNPVYHSAGNCIIETETRTLIQGCKNSVIPSDGSVTMIGDSAFYGCSSLTSINIPYHVTIIDEYAFGRCYNLTYVYLPSSVTTIGEGAFLDCYNLTSITIPDSVTTIGDRAFCSCGSLRSITIPDSVTTIGSGAFYSCESLTSITIPDSVTTIGDYAFEECDSLKSISIPDSVTTIGDYAFHDCTSLTSATLGNSVTNIAYAAFDGCVSLTNINLPGSLTSIGDYAFSDCDYLTSITIPDSVTTIGDSAFGDCSSLTSINIPSSVTTIGNYAFYDCDSLTSITIPDSVTTIGVDAFYSCDGLTDIYCETKSKPSGWSDDWKYGCDATVHWGCKFAKMTKQPVSVTAANGYTATVSVTATGDGLTYKWYYKNKGDSKFSLTNSFKSNTYSVEMNSTRAGRQVYCVITDKYGNSVQTNTVTLGMSNLKITKQPTNVAVQSGKTAKVTVTASGEGLTYKWYFKNKGDSKFTLTNTFKGNSYSIEMNSTRAGRQVYCVITDKYGATVKTNTVTLGMPVKITKQPTNVAAQSGKTAKVTVTASGDGLTYKWYYKNKGASKFSLTTSFTGNTYSVTMDSTRVGRQVYCVITDKYGNKVQTKTVTLGMAAKITTQPTSVKVANGKTAKVTVKASGEGLKYKWYYKDKGSSKFKLTTSFTGNSYSVTMTNARAGRQVYCVITDKYGNTVKTNTVTLKKK